MIWEIKNLLTFKRLKQKEEERNLVKKKRELLIKMESQKEIITRKQKKDEIKKEDTDYSEYSETVGKMFDKLVVLAKSSLEEGKKIEINILTRRSDIK